MYSCYIGSLRNIPWVLSYSQTRLQESSFKGSDDWMKQNEPIQHVFRRVLLRFSKNSHIRIAGLLLLSIPWLVSAGGMRHVLSAESLELMSVLNRSELVEVIGRRNLISLRDDSIHVLATEEEANQHLRSLCATP